MNAWLYRQVSATTDARPAAAYRLLVGGAAVLKALLILQFVMPMSDPQRVRIPWSLSLPMVPYDALLALLAIWLVAALAFLVGWKTRWSGAVLALAMAGVLGADQQLYSNHLYLLCILVVLLMLAGAGAALSLDARRGRRRGVVQEWPITLLKLQISVVYGYSALTKLNAAFLSGAILSVHVGRGAPLGIPEGLRNVEVMATLAIGAVLMELFLAFGLWFRATRPLAIAAGIVLHASIIISIAPAGELIVFAMMMMGGYLLFLDELPRWRPFHRLDRPRLDALETAHAHNAAG